MRPLWTDEELTHNRPDDWTFSDADRRQVQASSAIRTPLSPPRTTSGGHRSHRTV
jgi:hypothetical protein